MIDCISVPQRTETCPRRPFEGSSKGLLLSRDDFELFVRQYADRLNSVARRFFRSIDDAADAVQDAFLSAYAARHKFQGQSTVYTWLYRIVVNSCLMKVRSKRLKKNLAMTMGASDSHGPTEIWDAAAASASEIAETREMALVLHARINELRPDFRQVLLLRDIDELEIDEIAERVRVSPDAVKTRIYRARQALRALLTR